MMNQETICALSTPQGVGAIAVIRLSGENTFGILNKVFSKNLEDALGHTLHFGTLKDGDVLVDEVVVGIFRGKKSFTGENSAEISCHGSVYIQQQILHLLLKNGASMAKPGEFTMRAFFNGKMDLSQAEAVADLIHSSSEASHKLAMHQMRGGFSKEINDLREELINFASLIELELDFGEEDIEFADRDDLKTLVNKVQALIHSLIDSFRLGNVIKNGVPVAIIGLPNVGKSTLLNTLLNEDRAIVSEIAGTTRDTIEDTIYIEGIAFRFIDTAGIRDTEDKIETIGIEKTYEKVDEASILLYLVDAFDSSRGEMDQMINALNARIEGKEKELIIIANKIDKLDKNQLTAKFKGLENVVSIAAKSKQNINELKSKLVSSINTTRLHANNAIVSNSRHYEALSKAEAALSNVQNGLATNITGDFLAMDIRQALHHLGEITGEITADDLLGNIFSNFCIGK